MKVLLTGVNGQLGHDLVVNLMVQIRIYLGQILQIFHYKKRRKILYFLTKNLISRIKNQYRKSSQILILMRLYIAPLGQLLIALKMMKIEKNVN